MQQAELADSTARPRPSGGNTRDISADEGGKARDPAMAMGLAPFPPDGFEDRALEAEDSLMAAKALWRVMNELADEALDGQGFWARVGDWRKDRMELIQQLGYIQLREIERAEKRLRQNSDAVYAFVDRRRAA